MQSISVDKPCGKSRCADCKMCLQCSENRCKACRSGSQKSVRVRMSIRDQIALYEKLNSHISMSTIDHQSGYSSCVCAGHEEGAETKEVGKDRHTT